MHTLQVILLFKKHGCNVGFDRIFGSVRFGSAIRLISAGSVRFGFGSDYPNINRTSRARMSISNAPRVTKKLNLPDKYIIF